MRNASNEERAARRNRRIGELVEALGPESRPGWMGATEVTSIKIRFPTEAAPTTLLVIQANVEGNRKIGFVGAFSLGDALLALGARMREGSMRWREDVPWEQRQGK